MIIFLEYPKCSTCRKAKKFLVENNIEFEDRDIVLNKPTYVELEKWITLSKRDIKSFFNTSGNLYKELKLKEKLMNMSDEDKIKLLASNGMMIKRPIIVGDGFVLSGFREELWKEKML